VTTAALLAFGAALALAGAPPAPSERASSGKLLVLEPSASGVDGRLVLAVTAALAEAAASAAGRPVVTMLDLKDVLQHEEVRTLATCEDETRCQDSLRKLEGVELLISAVIGPVGKSVTLTLALLDAKSAVTRARATALVDDPEGLPKTARELVPELFHGEGGVAKAPARFALAGKKASVAVFDLVASGVPAETAANLTQILAVEVKRIPGTTVISHDDIRAVLNLEAQKQLLGCSDSTACLGEIGGALGVDYLLAGHVGRISETHVISLRLINPTNLEVKSRISDSFVGPEDQLVSAMRLAVRSLFGLEAKEPGNVTVSAGEGAGAVFLDGAARGPVAQPIAGVSPGRHTLRVVDPDFREWKGEVFIEPGANALSINLEPRPRRWYESWLLWGTVGLVAAGGATAAVAVSARGAAASPATYPFGFQVGLPKR
jgi:hypothetical protein